MAGVSGAELMAKFLISHPTGNMNVRQNALALANAGLLAEFWTCLNFDIQQWPWLLLPSGIRNQLGRRQFDLPDKTKIRAFPWHELGRLILPKLPIAKNCANLISRFNVDAVYRSLDEQMARRLHKVRDVSGVMASEDGACSTFRQAHNMGLEAIYELPIGHWKAARNLLLEEAEREPQWASTITGNQDPDEKLERKDQELRLASRVLVASSYTRTTLEGTGVDMKHVKIIPYGAVEAASECVNGLLSPSSRDQAKLRLLFVGSLTQRKGISYLFEAIDRLKPHVELTIIGRCAGPECRALEHQLKRHRWIPSLPRQRILEEMRHHDFLLLPSLFEGFGLVLGEALSQGLPIVATAHTGAPDIITDGLEGFIVPIRSASAIVERLSRVLENTELLPAMKEAAWQRAQQLTWQNYRHNLSSWLALS